MPLISVVVTAFNAAGYVATALESVLTQSAADQEVIVVDDASSDGTCARVEVTLRGRCEYHLERLPQNPGGPATPRNLGMQLARGRWIALLDSDDIWHPHQSEIQLAVAAKTGARFVSSEKRWFRDVGETAARATEELRVLKVPVARLDDLAAGWQERNRIFLKLDVQGFELPVLRAATETLKRCRYVYAECSHEPLSVGQALYDEVALFLGKAGFIPLRQINESRLNVRLVQADYLFQHR